MRRYLEIKEELIKIVAEMEPGKPLPSRPHLCDKLQTTRTTLDRAVQELEKEGVVLRVEVVLMLLVFSKERWIQ